MPSKEFVFKNDLGQVNIRQTLVGHRCLYQFIPQSQTHRGRTQTIEGRGGHWVDNEKQPRVRERCYRWATFPNDFCEFHMKNNNVLVRKGLGDARHDGIAVEAFNRDAPMGGVLFHAGDAVAGAIRDGRNANAQNKDSTGFIETENAAEITNRYGDDGTRNPYVLKIGANQYIDGSINRSLPIMMDRSEVNEQHNVKVMPGDEHTVGLHLHATKNIRNGEEMVVDAPPINTGNRITAKTVQKRGMYLAGRGGGGRGRGRMGGRDGGRGRGGPFGVNNDPLFDPNLEYNEEVYSALAKNVAFTGPGSKKRARTEYDSDSEDESLRSRTPPPPPPSPPPSDWNYDPDKDLTVADFNKKPENKAGKKKTKIQLAAEARAEKAKQKELAKKSDPLTIATTTLPPRNDPNKRNKTNTGELIFQLPLSASQVAILTSILLEHPRIGDKALTQQARARFALKNSTMTEQQQREAAAKLAEKRKKDIIAEAEREKELQLAWQEEDRKKAIQERRREDYSDALVDLTRQLHGYVNGVTHATQFRKKLNEMNALFKTMYGSSHSYQKGQRGDKLQAMNLHLEYTGENTPMRITEGSRTTQSTQNVSSSTSSSSSSTGKKSDEAKIDKAMRRKKEYADALAKYKRAYISAQKKNNTQESVAALTDKAEQLFREAYGSPLKYLDAPTDFLSNFNAETLQFPISASSSSSTEKNIITVTGKKPPGKEPAHLKPKPQEQPPKKKARTEAATTTKPTRQPKPRDFIDLAKFDADKKAAALAKKAAKEADAKNNKPKTKTKAATKNTKGKK